jgi:hypothetical protein
VAELPQWLKRSRRSCRTRQWERPILLKTTTQSLGCAESQIMRHIPSYAIWRTSPQRAVVDGNPFSIFRFPVADSDGTHRAPSQISHATRLWADSLPSQSGTIPYCMRAAFFGT